MSAPLSNRDLFATHAAPGLVGLCGGSAFIDRTIRRLQRPLVEQGGRSLWSHAFLVLDRRADGRWWVLESDLDMHRKQFRFGVQENREDKYWDEREYPNLALLDFQLDPESTRRVLSEALELLAQRSHYAVRELVGTLMALHRPALRGRPNVLAQEGAVYCSALVQRCFASAGVHFTQDVTAKNLTPQDLYATPVPHTCVEVIRDTSGKRRS
jgi:hypothetical protein